MPTPGFLGTCVQVPARAAVQSPVSPRDGAMPLQMQCPQQARRSWQQQPRASTQEKHGQDRQPPAAPGSHVGWSCDERYRGHPCLCPGHIASCTAQKGVAAHWCSGLMFSGAWAKTLTGPPTTNLHHHPASQQQDQEWSGGSPHDHPPGAHSQLTLPAQGRELEVPGLLEAVWGILLHKSQVDGKGQSQPLANVQ
ncbi:uncharacterized protein LOC103796063 [Callithrix jacchus]